MTTLHSEDSGAADQTLYEMRKSDITQYRLKFAHHATGADQIQAGRQAARR